MSSSSEMSSENYELCSGIARGMVKIATEQPHKVYSEGIRGFAEDRKSKKIPKDVECIAESTHDANDEGEVIDFMEIIKERRNKDPF